MAEENKTPEAGTPNGDPVKGGQGGEGEGKQPETKTFTQEDLDKTVEARLAREREKQEKAIEDRLKKERADWERQAKLSEEEKQKELQEKQKLEFQERERSITLRENRASAVEKLNELKIPTSKELVDVFVQEDLEKQEAAITAFHGIYTQAVKDGVAEALKGKAPTDVSGKPTTTIKPEDEPQFMGI